MLRVIESNSLRIDTVQWVRRKLHLSSCENTGSQNEPNVGICPVGRG